MFCNELLIHLTLEVIHDALKELLLPSTKSIHDTRLGDASCSGSTTLRTTFTMGTLKRVTVISHDKQISRCATYMSVCRYPSYLCMHANTLSVTNIVKPLSALTTAQSNLRRI